MARHESVIGPLAVGGATVSLTARTTVRHMLAPNGGVFHVRARPTTIEMLDADGQRSIARVHDLQTLVQTALAGVALAAGIAHRLRKKAT